MLLLSISEVVAVFVIAAPSSVAAILVTVSIGASLVPIIVMLRVESSEPLCPSLTV